MLFLDNMQLCWDLLPRELAHTLLMVSAATFNAILFGIPIGVLLFLTGKKEGSIFYKILGTIINAGRSIPFVILMIILIPFTRWIVGTSLGSRAAIIPLSVAAIPFFSRLVEGSFRELKKEILETAFVIGASPLQLVTKVLLPEALPSLIRGATLTAVNLVSYSAMAGLIGGGGLGKIAIQYGYQRFNGFLMIVTLCVLIVLVEGIQLLGNSLERKVLRKRGFL